jgi:hypothetical protein
MGNGIFLDNLKGRYHLGYLGVDGRWHINYKSRIEGTHDISKSRREVTI